MRGDLRAYGGGDVALITCFTKSGCRTAVPDARRHLHPRPESRAVPDAEACL